MIDEEAVAHEGANVRTASSSGLEISELSKRFGGVQALGGLSLQVKARELHGFVGANGAGKTTAMRVTMGVVAPDEGEVRFDGAPVGRQQRSRFGYMPEERGLYPKMAVGEQLTYFARLHGASRSDAREAARYWTQRLGVLDRFDDRLERLSLGNQQRVQLAAAFVHDPILLLLDEPFSGLDPVGVDALSEVLLERARAGTAVLFSSHQLDLVERLCRRVTIISEGRLVASGSVQELRAGERPLLRVRVAGEDPSWLNDLSGVEVIDRDGGGVLLSLPEGADTETILDTARKAGTIQHFGFERRSLAEIYREVVEQ